MKSWIIWTRQHTHKLPLILFASLTFFIPMQKQWHKSFDILGKKLSSENYPFETYFANKIQASNADLFILALLVLCLLKAKSYLKESLKNPFTFAVSGYLTTCLFSVLLSAHTGYAATYFIFLRYALFWGLYLLIASGLIERSFQKISTVFLTATAFSSFFEAAVSILQYFRQYSIGLKSLGETSFARNGKTPASFVMQKVSLWTFGSEYTPDIKDTIIRSYGTFAHPNILGWFLSIGILATLYLLDKASSKRARLFYSLALFIETFALFTSYSRSALLGMLFSLGCYLFLAKDKKKAIGLFALTVASVLTSTALLLPQLIARSQYANFFPVFSIYGVSLLSGLLLGYLLSICLSFRSKDSPYLIPIKKRRYITPTFLAGLVALSFIFKNKLVYMKTSLTAIFDTPRLVNPMIALKMIQTHPFFGVGYSLYGMYIKDYIPLTVKEDAAMTVHNIFLLIAAETGVIGLFFFLGIIIIPVWKITKNDLKREELFLVCMLILTLFVGMCDMHYLIFVQGRLFLISLLALLALKACHTTTETQLLTRASVNKL